MQDVLQVGKRYFPFHSIAYVDDAGDQVILTVRDVRSGSSEFRFFGGEAERLRDWLSERVALALDPEARPDDVGVRDDD